MNALNIYLKVVLKKKHKKRNKCILNMFFKFYLNHKMTVNYKIKFLINFN